MRGSSRRHRAAARDRTFGYTACLERLRAGTELEPGVALRNRALGQGAPLDREHYRAFGDLFGPARTLPRSRLRVTLNRSTRFTAPASPS